MTISRSVPLVGMAIAVVAVIAIPRGEALEDVRPPTRPSADCMSCHEDMQPVLEAVVPHEPAADGDCAMCHAPHAARFDHLLNLRERALCFLCHKDQKLAFQTGSVHTPIKQGQCVVCHQVHGSENEALLVTTGNELCTSCHEQKLAQLSLPNVHEPFGEGECLDCHAAHNSPHENQLMSPANAMCTLCHDVTEVELIEAHYDIPIKGSQCTGCHEPHASTSTGLLRANVHEPVRDGSCEMCHLVDSDTPQLVRATGGRLCQVCHRDTPRPEDTVVHAPVALGNCGGCHVPHASDHARLLIADPKTTCLSCHSELTERAKKSKSTHPIKDETGSCQACHQVHSSTEANLLNQGEIRTCMNCHETQRHGHPLGADRIDPRTGKGITCVTCHDPHGTEYSYQLRADQTRGLCVECHNSDTDGSHGGDG